MHIEITDLQELTWCNVQEQGFLLNVGQPVKWVHQAVWHIHQQLQDMFCPTGKVKYKRHQVQNQEAISCEIELKSRNYLSNCTNFEKIRIGAVVPLIHRRDITMLLLQQALIVRIHLQVGASVAAKGQVRYMHASGRLRLQVLQEGSILTSSYSPMYHYSILPGSRLQTIVSIIHRFICPLVSSFIHIAHTLHQQRFVVKVMLAKYWHHSNILHISLAGYTNNTLQMIQ